MIFWYKPGGGLKVWQRILVTERVLLLPTILFIIMYLDNPDLATLEILSAVYVFIYSLFVPWTFYEKINEKYGVLSKIRSIATYQYIQLIVVLPHIANKIHSFEIRTKNGCLYFITLAIIIYIILMYLTLGNGLLNLPDI